MVDRASPVRAATSGSRKILTDRLSVLEMLIVRSCESWEEFANAKSTARELIRALLVPNSRGNLGIFVAAEANYDLERRSARTHGVCEDESIHTQTVVV